MRILWAEFCLTGSALPKTPRPTSRSSPDEIQIVSDAHRCEDIDVVHVLWIWENYDIIYSSISDHENNGLVTPTAKSKRQKQIRYEWRYSNSMWYWWHVMKESSFQGLNLITCIDDATRCVTCARVQRSHFWKCSHITQVYHQSLGLIPPYYHIMSCAL